ncbi:hypothetical protein Glove_82g67 [Diversispora epigaea]|uniref:Uncharacterized protein n=1 Tax=Diversispora epigaea TaxID=1348612 RepID=A0A397JC97_9GLOM|nr:hypothetical protein Glove_82g67 [Diversispora epigaea]
MHSTVRIQLRNATKEEQKGSSECTPTHLVILKAGKNTNLDIDIISTCEQFYKDFDVDVFCDEAIFHHILIYHDQKSQIKPLLSQWHTSKDMCYNFFKLWNCNLANELENELLNAFELIIMNYSSKLYGCYTTRLIKTFHQEILKIEPVNKAKKKQKGNARDSSKTHNIDEIHSDLIHKPLVNIIQQKKNYPY